jgi:hypothetical protein
VFRVERKRGVSWYAKYRLPDGRQVQKRLGPAWAERGRPPAGYFTKRLAEDWLRETLHEARGGTLAGQVHTGATFADAAAEWLRYIELDRQRKPSTVAGYKVLVRSQLLPAFGSMALEDRLLRRINEYLVRWARWKYKRLRRYPAKARKLLAAVFRREPGLFAYWRFGVRPDGWTMGAG